MFNNLVDQNPGAAVSLSAVVSEPATINIISTSTPGSTNLYVNNMLSGATANVLSGDTVELRTSAPSTINQVEFIRYSVNGAKASCFVSTITDLGLQYQYRFNFADQYYLPINTVHETTKFTIYRLNYPERVRLDNTDNGARLVINGVDSGTSAIVDNGDVVSIKYTTPNQKNVRVEYLLAIGNYVNKYVAQTMYPDQRVSSVTFPALSGVSTSIDVESSSIILDDFEGTLTISADVPYKVNGVTKQANTNTIISSNTTVSLIVHSSEYDLATSYGTLSIENNDPIEFCVCTSDSGRSYFAKPEQYGKNLVDFTFTHSGGGKIGLLNSTNTAIEYHDVTAPTNAEYGDNHIIVTSPYEDCLYVFDAASYELQRKIDMPIGSKPYAIAYTPRNADNTVDNVKFVSLYGTGQLAMLDVDTYEVSQLINFSTHVKNIVVDNFGNIFGACATGLVARRTDGYAQHIVYDRGECVDVTMSETDGVFAAFADGTVFLIGSDLTAPHMYQTHTLISGICVHNGVIYAVAPMRNQLICIRRSDQQRTVINTLSYPFSCTLSNGEIVVHHLGCDDLLIVDPDTFAVRTLSTSQMCFGGYGPYLSLLYPDMPKEVSARATPEYELPAVIDAELNTPVQFSLDPLTFHQITSSNRVKVLVNGVEKTGLVSVEGADAVTFELHSSPDYSATTSSYINIDGQLIELSILTRFDNIIDFLDFGGVYDEYRRAQCESIELVVSGIENGHVASITYNGSSMANSIIVNDAHVGSSAIVTNGDVIRLVDTVEGVCGEVFRYTLSTGSTVVGERYIGTRTLDGVDFASYTNGKQIDLQAIHADYYTQDRLTGVLAATTFEQREQIDFEQNLPDTYTRQSVIEFNSLEPFNSNKLSAPSVELLGFNLQRSLQTSPPSVQSPGFDQSLSEKVLASDPEYSTGTTFRVSQTQPTYVQNIDGSVVSWLPVHMARDVYRQKSYIVFPIEVSDTIHRSSNSVFLRALKDTQRRFTPVPRKHFGRNDRYWNPEMLEQSNTYQHIWDPFSTRGVQVSYNTLELLTIKSVFAPHNTWLPMLERNSLFKERTDVHDYFKQTRAHDEVLELTATKNVISNITVAQSFMHAVAGVKYDNSPIIGLYDTEAQALAAGIETGFPDVSTYQFESRWTYKTLPDQSIVCILPEGDNVYPVAGYISGG